MPIIIIQIKLSQLGLLFLELLRTDKIFFTSNEKLDVRNEFNQWIFNLIHPKQSLRLDSGTQTKSSGAAAKI